MRNRDTDKISELRRAFRFFVYAILALFFIQVATSAAGFTFIYLGVQHDREARRDSRLALCQQQNVVYTILRDQLTKRIAQSEKYLRDHPHGAPGIPRRLIVDGIAEDKNQRMKLAPIDCVFYAEHPSAPPKGDPS